MIEQPRASRQTQGVADRLAVGLSLACLIHCLALPLIAASIPSLSAVLSLPEWTHLGLLALALPVSIAGLLAGYRKHGRWLPTVVGFIGLGFMALGAGVEDVRLIELGLTVSGTALVAIAHIRNWRLTSRACSFAERRISDIGKPILFPRKRTRNRSRAALACCASHLRAHLR